MSLIKKTTAEVYEKRRLDTTELTREEQDALFHEINEGGWMVEYAGKGIKVIYRELEE